MILVKQIKLNKNTKIILIVLGVAVAGYLAYRWYQSKQAANQSSTGLGSNLNSVAPALVAGSTGPQSGLNYYAGATNLFVTQPISATASQTSSSTASGNMPPGNPGGPAQWK
jgi:predicted negative regulator of RcsB-dependent stress response